VPLMLSAVQHQSKKEKIMLETEIKELTKAINAATEAVKVLTESLRSPVNAATDCEEEEPVKRQETLDDPQDQDITADSLQTMCMKAVRADEKNRQKIKEIIGGYGVDLIKDIPQDNYPELIKKLEALF
jgi:hypothetical protein